MTYGRHEFRDPIHNFITVDSGERAVIDSFPVQRLRNVHQLALTYLVYPGTTHRRFEHVLGVMHLASDVYDVLTDPARIKFEEIREFVPPPGHMDYQYWRKAVRMAALLHDVGHLPFSHAAEELLPDNMRHEDFSQDLILDDQVSTLLKKMKLDPDDVAKLAVGPEHYEGAFNAWELILTKIITGDEFGVDRMDYLLRDSLHAGVAYGRFDHHRLIDTLRILPSEEESFSMGIESGGLHAAEGMLLARYFMREQLYFHRVRRSYDLHLKDFLSGWLPSGKFPRDLEEFLTIDDVTLLDGMREALTDRFGAAHEGARRIIERDHFKLLYKLNREDLDSNSRPAGAIYDAACEKFGEECVKLDDYDEKGSAMDFPVLNLNDELVSAAGMSMVLDQIPTVLAHYVFIAPEHREDAKKWITETKEEVLTSA